MPIKPILITILTRSILIVLSWQNLFQLTPVVNALLEPEPIELAEFRLISANEGWLRLDQHLYWTSNNGQHWAEITPPNLGQSTIQAVWFFDSQSGWLVLTQLEASGSIAYALAQTLDGGATWQISRLSLFEPGDPNALAGAIYLHFVDAQTGWLVIKRATSSNFSVGVLFKTTDGGQTWTELAMPIAEPVYFVTPELGWTAGGPAGDQLYRTQDGGQTWQAQPIGQTVLNPDQRLLYRLPTFADERNGVLPVSVAAGVNSGVAFYLTGDGGETWNLTSTASLEQDVTAGTAVPLAILSTRRWLLIAPQSGQLVSLSNDNQTAITSQEAWISGIVELNMATPNAGWARYEAGSCTTELGQNAQMVVRCAQETRLLHTTDGGQTWAPLKLPEADSIGVNRDRIVDESVILSEEKPVNNSVLGQAEGDQTGIFIGQGFDKCEIASPRQLQTWLVTGPYRAVNLYIGGSSRYCANAALSAGLLAQLSQQGWYFIPTWVGRQAACTSYASRMSYDQATAYNQGIAEANAAIDAAHTLGLTLEDRSGTIIYYDLEYYDTTHTTCHEAARAFIAGWTGQLRGRGNQVGVYSTGSAFNGFASIPNVPDAIWPAHWIYSAYNPTTTVWNVYRLSNSLWNHQQRIRQYTGGHNETWGGLTLNIDSDVIEGIVASLRQDAVGVYLPLIMRETEAPPSSRQGMPDQ